MPLERHSSFQTRPSASIRSGEAVQHVAVRPEPAALGAPQLEPGCSPNCVPKGPTGRRLDGCVNWRADVCPGGDDRRGSAVA
eukprot:scaffold207191_cov35-Tisochrysis_lutea.AAC.1